jgi:Fe2+ transport system protein FeoA
VNLDEARKGQVIKITSIPDELIRVQALRLGISEGVVITCREVVPLGPVVVSRNKQEIAIGRNLARTIIVEPY